MDLATGAIVGVTVQDANEGDTTKMVETLITAAEQIEAVLPAGGGLTEVVADKGYHSNQTMVELRELGVRSDVSAPDRGRRNWKKKTAARSLQTVDGFGARAGNGCCGRGANGSNARLRISSIPGGCGMCICAGIPTS